MLSGIPIESYCRVGGCSTCRVRLLKGRVMLRRNDILEPEEIADGHALACQAVPQSTEIEIRLL
jgi:3-ketosteroid 9alpha-monooxygenase subunit B